MARRKRDAAMATHVKIDEFDPSHKAWATYVERLEFYFIANGIEDPEKKRAVLLTVSGPATYNLSAPMQKTGGASGPGKVALYPEALSYRAEVSVPQPYAKTGINCCNIRSGPAATIRVLRVRRIPRGHAA